MTAALALPPLLAAIRERCDRSVRRVEGRHGPERFSSDLADEVFGNVVLAVLEAHPTYGGPPAYEDEPLYLDEELAAVERYAAVIAKCACVDALGSAHRKGHRGGVASLGVEYADDPDECFDDNGNPTGAVFEGPVHLGVSEDAMIAAIDMGRATFERAQLEADPSAARGGKPLTSHERRWFWEDVQAWALRELRARFGEALQACPRPLKRAEAAWCAALPNPGLWDARTGHECVLELLASGVRSDLPITSTTTPAAVAAYELASMERALGRARARNRRACPTDDVVGVDVTLRRAG